MCRSWYQSWLAGIIGYIIWNNLYLKGIDVMLLALRGPVVVINPCSEAYISAQEFKNDRAICTVQIVRQCSFTVRCNDAVLWDHCVCFIAMWWVDVDVAMMCWWGKYLKVRCGNALSRYGCTISMQMYLYCNAMCADVLVPPISCARDHLSLWVCTIMRCFTGV